MSKLLDELCTLAESFTPNAVATVMLFSDDRETLYVEAAPSLTAEAIEAFDGLRPGKGSCGNAVFHNAPMFVCNTSTDARWNSLADIAQKYKIESCFSFPIHNEEGNAIGSFSISSFERRLADGFHKTLLETCATIASVILQRREDDALRNQLLEERIKADRVESIGTLAGGIAHDFNNLLTSIMGNVELAASSLSDEQAKDDLELATKAIRRATKLTGQLRSVATGRSLVRRPSNIGEIIRDSADFALSGSNCSFEIDGLETVSTPIINVDGDQIGQLIQNLVMNACQAMPNGGVVRIKFEETLHHDHDGVQKDWFRISVSDSGVGIPQAAIGNIFEPYVTTREKGSGLGLFVCYSIAQMHGGHISVQSEVGKGSRFTVDLPHERRQANTESTAPTELSLTGTNVLLMDDNPLVRRTLSGMLQRLGCNVWEAADGAEAIERYQLQTENRNPIDVTILDLTVPGGMGGDEAKDELRRFDPAAKIVASSGYALEGQTGYEPGFDAAMPKPYDLDVLQQVIAKLVSD